MLKADKYISYEFNSIIKDSREYRAYELGLAAGYYQLYKYVVIDNGKEKAEELFKSFIDGDERVYEYFRKLLELDKEDSNNKLETL